MGGKELEVPSNSPSSNERTNFGKLPGLQKASNRESDMMISDSFPTVRNLSFLASEDACE